MSKELCPAFFTYLPFCPRAIESSPSDQVSSMDFLAEAFRRSRPEQMSSMDRAALIALFHSTDGANWKRKSNWNTDAGLASWEGVRLNHAGRVVGLSLPNNNLHGSIPEALGALSELKTLAMHDNKLTGSIPRELGGLGKLEQLWLKGNELTGKGELISVLCGNSADSDALVCDTLCVFESLSWIGACYGALGPVCSWFVT
ncbi:unnamed protein product [Ectocarpus sp. CCAP 1310/34]|nr:unnamed protein product [Ectocarpus sp. CCAP 1310/34]